MTILVDDRTGSRELAPFLNSPHLVCRLDYADFSFPGNGPDGPISVGVERKALHDFIHSMTSGRLAGHQLIGLREQYEWVYVLIEGVWRPDRRTGVLMKPSGNGWRAVSHGSRRFMARDLWSFIHTLQVICGVIVVQTANQWETGAWLDGVYRWWSKDWNGHKSHQRFVEVKACATLVKPSLVARVASQFDGVGWDKAKGLGKRFGSLGEFMTAGVKELTEVNGIGPKIAESIVAQRDNPRSVKEKK